MVEFQIIKNVYINMSKPTHRLILGKPIETINRNYLPSSEGKISGEIGFMDYQIRTRPLPKKDGYELVHLKSLTILVAGIEPKYQKNLNNIKYILTFMENLAKTEKCQCICFEAIESISVYKYALNKNMRIYGNVAIEYLN